MSDLGVFSPISTVGDVTIVPPAATASPQPLLSAPTGRTIAGPASTSVVSTSGPMVALLSTIALERNAGLAALLQGLAPSGSSMLSARSDLCELVGALAGSPLPAPEALGEAMRTFVRALTTGTVGAAERSTMHRSGELAALPDDVSAALDLLQPGAHSHAVQLALDAAPPSVDEDTRSAAAGVARELGAEQLRVAAQWLADGRAELPIPVDTPRGPAWVRVRLRRRPTAPRGADLQGVAALELLVELPALGLVHVATTLMAGHLQTAINTSNEASARWLEERQPDLEAALGTAGLRSWSVQIRADAALVAREWAPWPLPTLEEGSLVDTHA